MAEIYEWQCTRKRPYKTKGQARYAKRIMRRKTGATYKTYRCEYCGRRHVAHRRYK